MKKLIITVVTLALMFGCAAAYAEDPARIEFTPTENEVISHMNYLGELSNTGVTNKGYPKEEMKVFIQGNVANLEKAYSISDKDLYTLMLSSRGDIPLPADYKAPVAPTEAGRKAYVSQLQSSMEFMRKKYSDSGSK